MLCRACSNVYHHARRRDGGAPSVHLGEMSIVSGEGISSDFDLRGGGSTLHGPVCKSGDLLGLEGETLVTSNLFGGISLLDGDGEMASRRHDSAMCPGSCVQ